MSLKEYLSDIADAIRDKKGTTSLINARHFADEIRNLSVGSGGGEITVIDVDRLPYAEDEGYLFENGEKVETYLLRTVVVHIVETLPEVGEPLLVGSPAVMNVYYQKADNEAYCYFTESVKPGYDVGWMDLAGGCSLLSITYGGVVTDESQATVADTLYLVYHASEYVNTNAIYRTDLKTGEAAYLFTSGARLDNYNGIKIRVLVIDTLPEVGISAFDNMDSPTLMTLYYQKSDASGYGYMNHTWYTMDILCNTFGFDYGGVITSEDQATDATKMYLMYDDDYILSSKLYYYRNGWKGIGTYLENAPVEPIIGDVPAAALDGTINLATFTPRDAIYFNITLSPKTVNDTLINLFKETPALIFALGGSEFGAGIYIYGLKSGDSVTMSAMGKVDGQEWSMQIFQGTKWSDDILGSNGVLLLPGSNYYYFVAPGESLGDLNIDDQQNLYSDIISFTPNFNSVGNSKTSPLAGKFNCGTAFITKNGLIDLSNLLDAKLIPTSALVNVAADPLIRIRDCSAFVVNITEDNLNIDVKMNGTKWWGDGSINDSESHTYNAPGTYVILSDGDTFSGSLFSQSHDNPNTFLLNATIGANVKNIAAFTFRYCINLTNVIIEDGVKQILAYNFEDSVKYITVPVSLIYVGDDAGLTGANVYYKGSLEDWCSITFYDWENLAYRGNCYIDGQLITELTIPESVTEIKAFTFYGWDKVVSVTIGNSVTRINEGAFAHCDGLTSINIPDNVIEVGVSAFYKCINLTNVYLGANVNLSGRAFERCLSLLNIDVNADNPYLESLDGNLYKKGRTVFLRYANDKSSREFSIPNTVTDIDVEAFGYSKWLTTIIIPESVTYIGGYAFSDCANLTNIIIQATTPYRISSGAFTGTIDSLIITVPKGCGDTYKSATNWSNYAEKIVEATE